MSSRLGIAGIVLLAAFGLAACGGGGDGTATMQGPTPAGQLATLQGEINALRAQLGLEDNGDVGASITALQNERDRLQDLVDEAADKTADAKRKADRAMAAKLYAGIGAAPLVSLGDGVRSAVYSGTNDSQISVTYDPDLTAEGSTNTTAILSEDKKTMVADNHGWAGKRYADPAGGDSVEAVVYSNVEAPTMGMKFSTLYTGSITAGVLAASVVELVGNANRVASPSFDQSSGIKRFPLPEPNPNDQSTVTIPGSFHGVSGTYSCTAGTTAICASRVAAQGFELGTVPTATSTVWTAASGQWTFTPANPSANVMSAPDTVYASYGWWLRKSADGTGYTASAFHDFRGTAGTVAIEDLRGTARYIGGAAGKYALTSETGGTNDAGHFTARVILDAEFGATHSISGTIDMFDGADGNRRDWSVALNEAVVENDGGIARAAANDTVWTIGGTASAASGEWSGNLREEGTDGVPKAATGTFYSTYGTGGGEGRMVGAFGANKR